MHTSKKPAKNSKHKKGDILIYNRHNGYAKRIEYHLVCILDAWYVKTNHYQVLALDLGGGHERLDIIEFSEHKFQQWYGDYDKNKPGWYSWKRLPIDDFSFLVVCGSPRQKIKDVMKSVQFHRKIQGMIARGQKIVDRWENINTCVGELTKKMEAEDGEKGNP